MSKIALAFVFLLIVAAAGNTVPARAYEPESHREIAQRAAAADVSALDRVLKTQLGLPNAVSEKFLGLTVQRLVGDGAFSEDSPPSRQLNHFHNPLLPWDQAGLRVVLQLGQSSVLWQQNPAQASRAGGRNRSWQNARRFYLTALTAPNTLEREEAFAQTFLTLGHLVHLVQDASVPAHVRNDPHLIVDGYERWVEATRANPARRPVFLGLLNQAPIRAPSSILTPTGDAQAPVPVARLIDRDLYSGSNPSVLTSSLGIAEFTNGNFVSDDTIFRDFAFPRPESLGPGFFVPEGRGQRQFFPKVADGEPVQHFVAEGTWFERLLFRGRPELNYIVTDRVYENYAAKLLPRSVGYSAALLDYFFRGQLRAVPFWNKNGIRLNIRNLTSDTMRGVFELHAIRQDGQQDKIATFGTAAAPLNLGPFGGTEVGLPTTFAPARRFALVFQGQLGDERPDPSRDFIGGVAAVIFDIEFVFIVQDSFDGPMAQFKCAPRNFPPPSPFSGVVRREGLQCTWLPRTVRIPGRFVTSVVDRPIIDEIRLIGGGSTTGEPRLIVDGVEQPGRRWARQDSTQPDPKTFVVEEAGIDFPGFYELDVTTRNGTEFETELALIDLGGSVAMKEHLTNRGSQSERVDLVTAGRSIFSEITAEDSTRDWREAQFLTLEISGVANPTRAGTTRRFGPLRPSGTFLEFFEGIDVDEDEYDQVVIDDFETFPEGTGAQAAYDALPGLAEFIDPIPEPGPPDVKWTASVERDYRTTELQFFQLFQIEPIFYTIPLRGE